MAVKQLEGRIDVGTGPDDRDLIIKGLRDQLRDAQTAAADERNKAARIEGGVRGLRKLLDPFHDWLGAVYGEFDAMGIAEDARVPASQSSNKWDAIKKQVPARLAEAIDILLAHGKMNTAQLAAAMGTSHGNCKDNIVGKLVKLGLFVREGRELRLKTL